MRAHSLAARAPARWAAGRLAADAAVTLALVIAHGAILLGQVRGGSRAGQARLGVGRRSKLALVIARGALLIRQVGRGGAGRPARPASLWRPAGRRAARLLLACNHLRSGWGQRSLPGAADARPTRRALRRR